MCTASVAWLLLPYVQGVPHFRGFWLMYAQVGDFHVSRGHPAVPLMQI